MPVLPNPSDSDDNAATPSTEPVVRAGAVWGRDSLPGTVLDTAWAYGFPLLALYDHIFDYQTQGRNWSEQEPNVELPNFPDSRYFNRVIAICGRLAASPEAPPVPGSEPGSPEPDSIPAQDAIEPMLDYIKDRIASPSDPINPAKDTGVFPEVPYRELLYSFVKGLQEFGHRKWMPWPGEIPTPEEITKYNRIWSGIDAYVEALLEDPEVAAKIAGLFLIDEPELMRRLPLARPVVAGVSSTNAVELVPVTFEVHASNRPYAWLWTFTQGATVLSSSQESPTITFPAAGPVTGVVMVTNAFGDSQEFAFAFEVAETDQTTDPVITGVYGLSDPGLSRYFIVPFLPNGPDNMLIGMVGGGELGEVGVPQKVEIRVATLNQPPPLDPTDETRYVFQEVGAAASDPEPFLAEDLTYSGLSTIRRQFTAELNRVPSVSVEFILEVSPFRVNPPKNWAHWDFLQAAAQRIRYTTGAKNWPVITNYSRCFLRDQFAGGRANLAVNILKTGIADDIPGCGWFADSFLQWPVILESGQGQTELPDLYGYDDYPYYTTVEIARAVRKRNPETTEAEIQDWLSRRTRIEDPVLPYMRFLKLDHILNWRFEFVEGRYVYVRRHNAKPLMFIAQAKGHPYPNDDTLPVDPGADPFPASDDPENPRDGHFLEKPTEAEARLDAWMAIALGADAITWFNQFSTADRHFKGMFNSIAKEIWTYYDLRANSILRSARGNAGTTAEGPYMGYNAPPVEHEKATFGNETIVSRYEMPLVVALLERRSDFTDPRDNSTRMAGEMALFVLNPSYRDRQVTLDFGDYFPGLGLRQFKYGEEDPANSSITACEGVISGSIRAYGVRIYHLVELP